MTLNDFHLPNITWWVWFYLRKFILFQLGVIIFISNWFLVAIKTQFSVSQRASDWWLSLCQRHSNPTHKITAVLFNAFVIIKYMIFSAWADALMLKRREANWQANRASRRFFAGAFSISISIFIPNPYLLSAEAPVQSKFILTCMQPQPRVCLY